jgi:putative transposase
VNGLLEADEGYLRAEKALVAALIEMYGLARTCSREGRGEGGAEELCKHAFSASAISRMVKTLDEPCLYLILDARYEKVRGAGVIASQAVLNAIAVGWEGRRQVLAVDLANRESRSSWKDFLLGLRGRELDGVEFVVSDDHSGLKAAIRYLIMDHSKGHKKEAVRKIAA